MKRWLAGVLALILILSLSTAAWGWQSLVAPIGGANPVSVKIVAGQNARDIADTLAAEGVIRSSLWLLAYLRFSPHSFLPGIYTLSTTGSSLANIQPLFLGTVAEKQVTIPEGLRANEIAQLLENQGVLTATDFLSAATYDPTVASLSDYQLKPGTFLEGFLFPDTYRFSVDATPAQVIERLLKNYRDRTQGLLADYDTVILASIIEREAKFDEDRAVIAGVFENRLALGMALQADSTLQYANANAACGSTPLADCTASTWWSPVAVADFQSDSPYNTYRLTGLPPSPITNPGLKSLEAAANPASHDYFYFITDSTGHAHFAKTLAEHNQNIADHLVE